MRKLIGAMKMSIDGKIEGPSGVADWVEAWSDDYQLSPQIDACVIGGGMYPGYEIYWTAIQNFTGEPLPMTGRLPSPEEIAWGKLAARTPHYVLSRSAVSAQWPQTRFLRGVEELAALKRQPGKDIYLMGGARVTAALIDAGLVDELRLILYPLIAGEGKALFATLTARHGLALQGMRELSGGRVGLTYRLV